MRQCESKTDGVCARPATWEQDVHAGNRDAGRLLYRSYWCDEHAERITQRRRQNWMPPPAMTRIDEG
jgi:hypothetical protein